jgi:hypothetical protein
MNANPESDIQEFFQGRDEYAKLRVPNPDEQKLFAAYDFDYTKDLHLLMNANDFNFSFDLADTAGHDLDEDPLRDRASTMTVANGAEKAAPQSP